MIAIGGNQLCKPTTVKLEFPSTNAGFSQNKMATASVNDLSETILPI
jgi:hypothetical protein